MGRCAISLRPQAARCPCHRISCASSTHFQCSTGRSFSCSTVSSCCSPARSAGPPAGTKKSHLRAPEAHDPLEGPEVTSDKDCPSLFLPLGNEGLTLVAFGGLEGRHTFAIPPSYLLTHCWLTSLLSTLPARYHPSVPTASYPLRTLHCCQAVTLHSLLKHYLLNSNLMPISVWALGDTQITEPRLLLLRCSFSGQEKP